MKFKKIVALVPMRHHSQRVPEKNFRLLAGKPLYAYILETLQQCSAISEIVVDTDSPDITKGIKDSFPSIKVIDRPESLRADDISMNEILLHDTSLVQADLYIQTHSTNPLVKPETISNAIQTLEKVYPTYDSLFAVTRIQIRLWDGLGRPINHNPATLIQTQDLPPIYEENSCFYLFTRPTLERRRNRIGDRPYLFVIDRSEAWDIDDKEGFLIVDLLMNHRLQNGK